jgi:hypothetical protein
VRIDKDPAHLFYNFGEYRKFQKEENPNPNPQENPKQQDQIGSKN